MPFCFFFSWYIINNNADKTKSDRIKSDEIECMYLSENEIQKRSSQFYRTDAYWRRQWSDTDITKALTLLHFIKLNEIRTKGTNDLSWCNYFVSRLPFFYLFIFMFVSGQVLFCTLHLQSTFYLNHKQTFTFKDSRLLVLTVVCFSWLL